MEFTLISLLTMVPRDYISLDKKKKKKIQFIIDDNFELGCSSRFENSIVVLPNILGPHVHITPNSDMNVQLL